MKRWREYFQDLLDTGKRSEQNDNDHTNCVRENIQYDSIMYEEIKEAIRKLKNGKLREMIK